MVSKIIYFIRLLRVKQWIKNLFIFFPLIFAGKIFDGQLFVKCFMSFFGFCLLTSSVYILNDFLDRHKDRLHPRKAKRPLAQGAINRPLIVGLIIILFLGGLFVFQMVNKQAMLFVLSYVALHLIYNFYTKRVIILDVISVAVGFQIRIWVGAIAAEVIPSVWLQMCVFLLALFLGFTKRRYEIVALRDKASDHRNVLAHYTSYLLDQIIIICSTLSIVFYGLYCFFSDIVERIGSYNMVYSVIFVIYGVFRYLYLVHVKRLGDDPGEVLFLDFPLAIDIVLWIGFVFLILYCS